MRELTNDELPLVSGGGSQTCTPENSYGGVTNTRGVGSDLVNIYEGLVFATSHIIERVAKALQR